MSTIKWKFNIWTIAMFMGCLALSIVITQPILARANNEWGDVVIDTTFSDTKNMSINELVASNISSDNITTDEITTDKIMMWEWGLCNEDSCAKISGDILYVDKIRIWNGPDNSQSTLLISWGILYYTNDVYGSTGAFWLYNIGDVFSFSDFMDNFAGKLGRTEIDSEGTYFTPAWEDAGIIFDKNKGECNTESAGSLKYVENDNWSQLIMCMKISESEYSGVVLKEF